MTVCLDSRVTQHKTHIWYVKQDLLKTCFCMAWSILCSFHQNILNIHEIQTWSIFYWIGISWYKFSISARVLMNSVCSIKYKLLAFYYAADTEYEYLVTVSDQLLSKVRCSDNFLRAFPGNTNFHDWSNFLTCPSLFARERMWSNSFCHFKIFSRLILNKCILPR